MDSLVILLPLLFVAVFLVIILILIWILLSSLNRRQKYGVKSVTLRGEKVKSIVERRIADYFERNNIRYVYEQETRWGTPDFYLPVYDVYVEYWGLVDADDNWTRTEYVRNMKRKMAIYHRNNVKLISIYPRNLENFDWIFRAKFKKTTGYELPN
jgi:hypothetical protein